MLGYTALLYASVNFLTTAELSEWQRIAIAASPVIPGLYALHAVVVFYRTRDEFKRRIISESMLGAAIITGFATFAYGFISDAVELPVISFIWVLPVMLGLAGAIGCVLRWIYR